MSGAKVRAGRLFNHESGRCFCVAFDHGLPLGPITGAEDALATVERIVSFRTEAVLLSPGLLDRAGHLFGHHGAPVAILRADYLNIAPGLKDQGMPYRVIASPTEAVRLGADAIVMFLVLGMEDGEVFADNLEAVARAASEAHALGLPIVVETTLWGPRIEDKRDPDLLALGCRMAAELGADVVKTEYTGDPATMAKVIAGCGVPVLVLGGPLSDQPGALIAATRGALAAGAKGVMYGRNVWQAADAAGVASELRDAIHSPQLARV